jgi:hypothetical protein
MSKTATIEIDGKRLISNNEEMKTKKLSILKN